MSRRVIFSKRSIKKIDDHCFTIEIYIYQVRDIMAIRHYVYKNTSRSVAILCEHVDRIRRRLTEIAVRFLHAYLIYVFDVIRATAVVSTRKRKRKRFRGAHRRSEIPRGLQWRSSPFRRPREEDPSTSTRIGAETRTRRRPAAEHRFRLVRGPSSNDSVYGVVTRYPMKTGTDR